MKMSDLISQPYSRTRVSMVDKYGDKIITCESEWHMSKVEAMLNQHDKLIEFVEFTAKYSVDEQIKKQAIDLLSELSK